MVHQRGSRAMPGAGRKRSLLTGCLSACAAALSLLPATAVAGAQESSCPDTRVVFARGTNEAPGVGATGQAFVDALTVRTAGGILEVTPVQYPASMDFHRGIDGVIDAMNTISTTASTCPDTRIVLGGYSQGAAVAAYTVTGSVPPGFVLPVGVPGPLPPAVVELISAVVLFGLPRDWVISIADSSAPPVAIDEILSARTIEMCAPGDPICAPGGLDRAAHSSYRANGMVDEAAAFTATALTAR